MEEQRSGRSAMWFILGALAVLVIGIIVYLSTNEQAAVPDMSTDAGDPDIIIITEGEGQTERESQLEGEAESSQ